VSLVLEALLRPFLRRSRSAFRSRFCHPLYHCALRERNSTQRSERMACDKGVEGSENNHQNWGTWECTNTFGRFLDSRFGVVEIEPQLTAIRLGSHWPAHRCYRGEGRMRSRDSQVPKSQAPGAPRHSVVFGSNWGREGAGLGLRTPRCPKARHLGHPGIQLSSVRIGVGKGRIRSEDSQVPKS
jgi:hypothetical protein